MEGDKIKDRRSICEGTAVGTDIIDDVKKQNHITHCVVPTRGSTQII